MIRDRLRLIFSILKESPFFNDLLVKERETIIEDLLRSYPRLTDELQVEDEVGYEASWLMRYDH